MQIVITTIFPPTTGTRLISSELARREGDLWVMGDRVGPKNYDLPRVRFYDIEVRGIKRFHCWYDEKERMAMIDISRPSPRGRPTGT